MYKFVSYHGACWRLCTGSSCLINGGLLSYAFAMQQRHVCRGRHLGNNGRWSVTWRLRFVDVQSVVLQNRRSFDFRKLKALFFLLTNYSTQSIMLLPGSFPQDSSLRRQRKIGFNLHRRHRNPRVQRRHLAALVGLDPRSRTFPLLLHHPKIDVTKYVTRFKWLTGLVTNKFVF